MSGENRNISQVTVTLQGFQMPAMLLGLGNARYFQEITARPDDEPSIHDIIRDSNGDENIRKSMELAMGKKVMRINRMKAVKQMINFPAFKLLESALLSRVKAIEERGIWLAKKNGDKNLEEELTREHEGIVKFFLSFNNIDDTMELALNEINDFKKYLDSGVIPQEEDPRADLHKPI